MLAAALRQSGSVVGVTGEGLGDARALSEADVGFAMGMDGVEAAKDHADIIMMDDKFDTLNTAIRFGRNIQENVRKFVMFQMTVNIVTMIFVISTVLIIGHSPFNVVQLLWINIVMDVLAAIAFSTEQPGPDMKKDRISPKEKIMTKTMMRQILFQALYQLIVMIILLYVAPIVGDYQYNLFTTPMKWSFPDYDSVFTARAYHQTFMFQCFIVMNLFNMINCRVVDPIPQPLPELDDENLTQEERDEMMAQWKAASAPKFNIFERFW